MPTRLRVLPGTFSLIILAGCVPVHPIIDEKDDSTRTIVMKVRCEARDAVIAAIEDFVRNKSPEDISYLQSLGDDFSPLLRLRRGEKITEKSWDYLFNYYNGAIAYEFDIGIEVTQDHSLGVSFLNTYRHSTASYDIGAGLLRTNTSSRTFKIADNVSTLLSLKQTDCTFRRGVNYLYPIKGDIGLREIVKTYVSLYDLNVFDRISDEAKLKQFSDVLTFKTKWTGRVNPTLSIYADDPKLSLVNSGERIDTHKITVALNVPAPVRKAADAVASAKDTGALYNRKKSNDSAEEALKTLQDRRFENYLDALDRLQ